MKIIKCDVCKKEIYNQDTSYQFKMKTEFTEKNDFGIRGYWMDIDICPTCERNIIKYCKEHSK